MISRICFTENVKSGAARPCSREDFDRIVDDPKLRETLDRLEALAAAGDKKAYSALKETLTAFAPHAMRYEADRRLVKNAIRSGLVILDVDHIDDPLALYQRFVEKGGFKEFKMIFVHRTPSGKGLRFVFERTEDASIADDQLRLARFLDVAHDTSTCDDARASFAVSRDRFYFLAEDLLWYPDDDTPENRTRIEEENQRRYPSSEERGASPNPLLGEGAADAPIEAAYDASKKFGELLYTDIIDRYFQKKLGHMPMEGERNVQLLAAARDLWAITEGSEEKLKQILPTLGLSDAEMNSVVHNAAAYRKANPIAKIPYLLWAAIKELEEEKKVDTGIGDEFDASVEEVVPDEVLEAEKDIPALPPVIRELVSIAPAGFKVPTIIASLPALGTALSRLRAQYIDGQMTYPGFHCVLEAAQASGKSFAGRVVDTILKHVKEHDKEQRAIEREYERQMKLNKNARKQEPDPMVIVQCVPASISIAKILKRFECSRELALFSFSAELDTLTNSNKRGGWAQKIDLYRLAWDGCEEYGQDYMSDNSYSTTVKVRYNILSTGTPKAIERFYTDAEDGLVSRCLIGSLANQQYRSIPTWGKLTKAQSRTIDTKMRSAFDLSYDENGNVQPEYELRMPWLCGEINLWLERKRVEAAKASSIALDTFRRRSALNAFRAGMLAWWLWGENPRHRKEVTNFALFIADLTLAGQMRRFGDKLEAMYNGTATTNTKSGRSTELYDMLPDTFTSREVAQLASELNIKTVPKMLIYTWRTAGLIEKISKHEHRKLTP